MGKKILRYTLFLFLITAILGLTILFGLGGQKIPIEPIFEPSIPPTGPTPEIFDTVVVVAIEDISANTTILPNMLTVCNWPSAAIPETSLSDINDVIGRQTVVEIPAHTAVVVGQFRVSPVGVHLQATQPPIGFKCPDWHQYGEVVIAVRKLEPGTIITVDDVEIRSTVKGAIPNKAFTNLDLVIGRRVQRLIPLESLILNDEIGAPDF